MKKTKNYGQKRKGAALVVAILLAAIIGSVAIGVTAIAFRQVNIAETYNNGLAAFYAAESGEEQGLLNFKYDKNIEIPANITTSNSDLLKRQPINAYRNYLNLTPMRSPINNSGVTGPYSLADRTQVYDLRVYYQQAFTGDDVDSNGLVDGNDLKNYSTNSQYTIAKDDSKAFAINAGVANDVNLFWKWITPSCNGKSRALEVRVKDSASNEHTSLFQDPSFGCPNITNAENSTVTPGGIIGVYTLSSLKTKMNITALTITEMTLKPVGGSNDGIYFGFTQGAPGMPGQRYSSGLTTTIKSTGYFAGNSRQITADVDRQTGTILDIFNYVVYKGQ
ncbi:MAG: pilus assembly PilX N-terminal domain-containing protein [Candidatus Berkelbacteria bacterium]|nr:pilus assembly PilX N-terminal domain-containing protein [Candidatus Berkelbacteria bacterium]